MSTEPSQESDSKNGGQNDVPPDEDEQSLEMLGRVYREAMARRAAPPVEETGQSEPADTTTPRAAETDDSAKQVLASDPARDDEDPVPVTPRTILEAMLFVGSAEGGLTTRQAASLIRGVSPQEVEQLVDELNASYDADQSAFRIRQNSDGLHLALQQDLEPIRQQLYGRVREARLGHAAIEALAVVAYHQPVTHEEVDRLRNRQSGPVLNLLVRRDLLSVERDSSERRVRRYRTTPRFLKLFGMESIDDLPQATTPQGADFLDES
jgi:segregation and condensation protein B